MKRITFYYAGIIIMMLVVAGCEKTTTTDTTKETDMSAAKAEPDAAPKSGHSDVNGIRCTMKSMEKANRLCCCTVADPRFKALSHG